MSRALLVCPARLVVALAPASEARRLDGRGIIVVRRPERSRPDASAPGGWKVNAWVKQGILLGFRYGQVSSSLWWMTNGGHNEESAALRRHAASTSGGRTRRRRRRRRRPLPALD